MFTYDVALSFAGEDRETVREIAKKLKGKKLKVFYDEFEEVNLLGKDLYQYLHYVYKEAAIFCVVFVSSNYMKKLWTKLELQSAQNRAFLESREYILPLRIEPNVQLPGLSDTIGYIDINKYTINQITKILYDKVCTIKPTKEYELLKKKKMYDLIFEIFDFIVTRYACFGNGSRIAELSLLECLIKDYRNFLFDYLQEINKDLYSFLLPILKELQKYVDASVERGVCFTDTFNLKYHVNFLQEVYFAFEKSNFSDKFDFNYYIYANNVLNDTNDLLIKTMKEIANKIMEDMEHPIGAIEYLKRSVYLSNFEIYLDNDAERVLNLATNISEVHDIELWLEESEIFTHEENQTMYRDELV